MDCTLQQCCPFDSHFTLSVFAVLVLSLKRLGAGGRYGGAGCCGAVAGGTIVDTDTFSTVCVTGCVIPKELAL